ncbi:energy transducer TonB family protein [Fuscibacter oryzae]|uniref:Energy transducer TonB n=1 Tax=Fuscibacter oryzae TaxID=2803939 RepID=A0A8J7MVX9_9RHOB|nr:energy transducer TonB [Fuscibacter oryzae]MBL4928609.1 energy transducer TonB [Fuscibacter oryzae]
MTDWSARHRPRLEPLGWLAAATLAALLAISTAAFANWFGGRVGTGTSESTILLDLPPLPPALAVAEPPAPQPVTPPPPPELQAVPRADESAPPAPQTEDAPDLTPPDRQTLTDLPDALPTDEALPAKSEHSAKPAAKKKTAQKPAKKAEPAASAATAKGEGVTASAMRKWTAKASQRLDRHMRRGSYNNASGTVAIRFQVAASGQITGAKLIGSTGSASLDAALLAQARRAPALPERPDGKSGQIEKTVTVAP